MPPTSYSWPLSPDPTSPGGTSPEAAATQQAAANAAAGQPAFLGVGLLRPFRRDMKSDFATGTGLALVVACVGQILGTKADTASTSGELPWRTDFGSRVHLARHRNNSDALSDFLTVLVQEALSTWEPRVRAVTASIDPTFNQREKRLRVKFDVVDRGGRVLLAGAEAVVPLSTT